jgi:predicted acylesterase/phospholipase RssA
MDKISNISHVFLTGGGLKGLCYLGIIRYFYLENMVRNMKHIVGTSIGAYFGLILGLQIPIEYIEEEIGRLVENLSQILTIDHHNISNLFNKNGIFIYEEFFTPILTYMKNELHVDDMTFVEYAKKTGINLYVNAVNINTGKSVIFSTDNTPNASVITAVKASMSVPFLYQPVLIDGEYYIDGIISTFDIFENVDKNCQLIIVLPVDNESQITVYPKKHEFNFLQHFIRINEIMIGLINTKVDDEKCIFKIKQLVYDKFLKIRFREKSIFIDVCKHDMDDMIVQGFVDFSVYMKQRYVTAE